MRLPMRSGLPSGYPLPAPAVRRGSFSTAFVPVFTEVKETRSHAELRELMARTAGTLGGVLMLVTALALIFAPQLAVAFSRR